MCYDSEIFESVFVQKPRSDGPQSGRFRMIIPAVASIAGTGLDYPEAELIARMDKDHVFMMGDNPALPKMPEKPTLIDFFKYRLHGITRRHLLTSALKAMEQGQPEELVLACLLHDFAVGGLIRSDHGYWGAQLLAPYVSEAVAWGIQYHQCLRYFADEAVGYAYPESYDRFFGPDFEPADYLKRDAAMARQHKWYMHARTVTLYDTYFFDDIPEPEPEVFADIIGRHFRQPVEGLGFDGSPVAHMWRSMIWPNNLL